MPQITLKGIAEQCGERTSIIRPSGPGCAEVHPDGVLIMQLIVKRSGHPEAAVVHSDSCLLLLEGYLFTKTNPSVEIQRIHARPGGPIQAQSGGPGSTFKIDGCVTGGGVKDIVAMTHADLAMHSIEPVLLQTDIDHSARSLCVITGGWVLHDLDPLDVVRRHGSQIVGQFF